MTGKNVNYMIIFDGLIYMGAENPIERGLAYEAVACCNLHISPSRCEEGKWEWSVLTSAGDKEEKYICMLPISLANWRESNTVKRLTSLCPEINLAPMPCSGTALPTARLTLAGRSVHGSPGFPTVRECRFTGRNSWEGTCWWGTCNRIVAEKGDQS